MTSLHINPIPPPTSPHKKKKNRLKSTEGLERCLTQSTNIWIIYEWMNDPFNTNHTISLWMLQNKIWSIIIKSMIKSTPEQRLAARWEWTEVWAGEEEAGSGQFFRARAEQTFWTPLTMQHRTTVSHDSYVKCHIKTEVVVYNGRGPEHPKPQVWTLG